MALRRLIATAAVLAVVTAGAATGAATGAGAHPTAARPRVQAYDQPGPYAAGVTTLRLADRDVEVWYPAKRKAARGAVPASFDVVQKAPPAIAALLPTGTAVTYETDAFRDIPAAKNKRGFPLVLMAHGTAAYREQLSYLASHLASWGFVVASPDILERGLAALLGSPPAAPLDDVAVMRETETLLRAEHARVGGPLEGRVLPGRVAVTGQSAGGSTAIRYASEPGVVVAIPISASGFDPTTGGFVRFPNVPMTFVTGAADQVVPVGNVEDGFAAAAPPARFVAIEGAGHASVAGICPIGGPGGLVGLAESASLPVPDNLERLAADGCTNPAPDPDPSWAPIRHAVTAQLRLAYGIDREPVGLDQVTMDRFAPVVVRYQERLP